MKWDFTLSDVGGFIICCCTLQRCKVEFLSAEKRQSPFPICPGARFIRFLMTKMFARNAILVTTVVIIWKVAQTEEIDQCMELRVIDENGVLKCVDCKRCQAGTEPYPRCHVNKTWDAKKLKKGCKSCPPGTFQQFNGSTLACQNWSHCMPNYKVLKKGTNVNDIQCSNECEYDFYKWKDKCIPCCECIASEDKEPLCSGTKKHCRSHGGKCKPVPVDPALTTSIVKTTLQVTSTNKVTPALKTTLVSRTITMTSPSTKIMFNTRRSTSMTTSIPNSSIVTKSSHASVPLLVTPSKSIKDPLMTSSAEVNKPSPRPTPDKSGRSPKPKALDPAVIPASVVGGIIVALCLFIMIFVYCRGQGNCRKGAGGHCAPRVFYNPNNQREDVRFAPLAQDSPMNERRVELPIDGFPSPNTSLINTTADSEVPIDGFPSPNTSLINTTADSEGQSDRVDEERVEIPLEKSLVSPDLQGDNNDLIDGSEDTDERYKRDEAVATVDLSKPENKALKIPSKAEILGRKNCIICMKTKQENRSTLSTTAAREIVEVEHALLHFCNLDKELNDKDCDKIYRTLTGETAPNTGVRDGETLFQKIRTELPGLTVASFFMVLNIIGKKNVAIKIHDNFHSDFEEILAVKKCIICDNTDESKGSIPDRTLEKKLAAIDDSESVLEDLMKGFEQKDCLKIYQILFRKKPEKSIDLRKEVASSLRELNIANLFKLLELMSRIEVAREIHDSIHQVLIVDP